MFVRSSVRCLFGASIVLLAVFGFIWLAKGHAMELESRPLVGDHVWGGLENTALQIAITAADFNGDDFPDIALVNRSANVVLIYISNGDGTFADPVSYPVGSGPVAIATGDFNNDEIRDLVVANAGSNNLSILLGNGGGMVGDGTFRLVATVPVDSTPTAVTVEDFNVDDVEDIAVTTSGSNRVSILFGIGNGTFEPPIPYAVGTNPVGITLEDFNRDGVKDIAVANAGSGNVSVLLAVLDEDRDPTGAFRPAINSPALAGVTLIVGDDLNGSDNGDLVVGSPTSNMIAVLFGSGTGTFRPGLMLNVGAPPTAIEVDTLAGGVPRDIIVATPSSNTVTVFLGSGTGTFSAPMPYTVPNGPSALAISDFDLDTILDVGVATTDNAIQILFGLGDGTLSPPGS